METEETGPEREGWDKKKWLKSGENQTKKKVVFKERNYLSLLFVCVCVWGVLKYPFLSLFEVKLQWWGSSDISVHSKVFLLFLGDREAIKGQMRYIISPACSGSSLRSPAGCMGQKKTPQMHSAQETSRSDDWATSTDSLIFSVTAQSTRA